MRLPTTKAFYPTQDRSWLIDFWTLDVKWVFVSLPFGFLVMLLFYYDHVSRPESEELVVCYSNISAERQQHHRASTSISFEKAGWFPLGLLSPRLHHFCGWYSWTPASEWSCSSGQQLPVASEGSQSGCLPVLTDLHLGSSPYRLSNSLPNRLEDYPNTRG
jgi:hypothetical protein